MFILTTSLSQESTFYRVNVYKFKRYTRVEIERISAVSSYFRCPCDSLHTLRCQTWLMVLSDMTDGFEWHCNLLIRVPPESGTPVLHDSPVSVQISSGQRNFSAAMDKLSFSEILVRKSSFALKRIFICNLKECILFVATYQKIHYFFCHVTVNNNWQLKTIDSLKTVNSCTRRLKTAWLPCYCTCITSFSLFGQLNE